MILPMFVGVIRGRQLLRAVFRRGRQVYVKDRVAEYRQLWLSAALALGATFVPVTQDAWEITLGEHRTRVANDLVELDDPVILRLAGDKEYCGDIATAMGIPTSRVRTLQPGELDAAIRTLSLDGTPLVIKPASGTGSGVGCTVDVRSRWQLANSIALASIHSPRVLVERLVAAETVRLLFLDGEMIHAVRRTGVRVVGDGSSTIRSLLAALPAGAVKVDRFVEETLRQQDRTVDDIPAAGESVVARWLPAGVARTDELRTIYDEDVTDLVGPELIAEIARIVTTVGPRLAAADVLTNDPTRRLEETGGVFLELNTTPGLHHHCPASDGRACPVAVRILEKLLT